MAFFASKDALRKLAEQKGLTVTEVERVLPVISADGVLEELERDNCVRYALPRTGGTRWEMLMRDEEHGAQLPNGFLVEGDVTPQLLKALRPLAEQFDSGLLELEGVNGEVAAFWDEDGGKDEVEAIHAALLAVRDL